MNETILVVDDEREIADLLEIYLKNDGYTVHTCATGAEALRCVESEHIDLALLDVMLPDIDGFSLCRKIRESRFFPILMLTARVADSDKILGLTIGADDYITKPFNPLEVVARVKRSFAVPGTTTRAPPRRRRASNTTSAALRSSAKATNARSLAGSLRSRRSSFRSSGISARGRGASCRPRSCSRPCGRRNICKTATTPSWRTSPGCVKR